MALLGGALFREPPMEWSPSASGWSAEIDKDSSAEIMDRSRQGFHIFKIVLKGKSGSLLSAQARVEAIVDLVQGASDNEASRRDEAVAGALRT